MDVECEAHAKGVDARTAGNEKTRAYFVGFEMRQSEQARAEANRDRNLLAEHRVNWKAAQAQRKGRFHHEPPSLPGDEFSPPQSLTSPFFPVCGKKGELGGVGGGSVSAAASLWG